MLAPKINFKILSVYDELKQKAKFRMLFKMFYPMARDQMSPTRDLSVDFSRAKITIAKQGQLGIPNRRATGQFQNKIFSPLNFFELIPTQVEDLFTRQMGHSGDMDSASMKMLFKLLDDKFFVAGASIDTAKEILAMNSIIYGEITPDNQLIEKIVYGRSAENELVLSGNARWDQAGASILDNIATVCNNVLKNGHITPSFIITTDRVKEAIFNESSIKSAKDEVHNHNVQEKLERMGMQNLVAHGTVSIGGFKLDIMTYSAFYDAVDGTRKEIFPNGELLISGKGVTSFMGYGAIPKAMEMSGGNGSRIMKTFGITEIPMLVQSKMLPRYTMDMEQSQTLEVGFQSRFLPIIQNPDETGRISTGLV